MGSYVSCLYQREWYDGINEEVWVENDVLVKFLHSIDWMNEYQFHTKMLQSFSITSNKTFENISIYYSKSIVYIIYYSVGLSLTV